MLIKGVCVENDNAYALLTFIPLYIVSGDDIDNDVTIFSVSFDIEIITEWPSKIWYTSLSVDSAYADQGIYAVSGNAADIKSSSYTNGFVANRIQSVKCMIGWKT